MTTKKHRTKNDARRAARARQRIYKIIIWIGLLILAAVVVTMISLSTQKTQTDLPAAPTAGGPTPELIGEKQYSAAPPFLIDVNKQYLATVKMATGGEFVIELYPLKAPITVNNFVFLARDGYFDNVTFHRVLEGFMAQTGDPTGTGMGDPGYSFVDEPNDLTFDKAGVVAMANSGPDTNGSQFFITFAPTDWLNGKHTIFGQVIEGMDVVTAITLRDPTQNPDYLGDAIESITITEK
jgi:peptidylprolyl isomerase